MTTELKGWRKRAHAIIYESETPHGRLFDKVLIWAILLSVLSVVLESIPSVNARYDHLLLGVEWFFTILFTIEYIFRLVSVLRPWLYAKSFFGIVDLLAILPAYISLFFVGFHALLVFRIFRLFRVFRTLKMVRYVTETDILARAFKASRTKIVIFLIMVFSLVVFMGTIMYIVEEPNSAFGSIPSSMYWTVVTMTTVGYGDIVPQTVLGKFIASILMIMGYLLIAVPTGIVSVELVRVENQKNEKACEHCGMKGHDYNATYCKNCGGKL
jgi:voltage-gated potassium channel